jgi:N4-gp56 family major capsid protein
VAYQPAANSTQTASLAHLATVYYKKVGLDKLYQSLRFMSACEPDDVPSRSGKTVQWFRFDLLGANTTPSAEGVVGTGIPLTSRTISATVDQYSDFTSLSTLLEATAINSMVQEASEQMSYRAALSVDNITRAEIDGNFSNAQVGLTSIGTSNYLCVNDFRKMVALLKGKNVMPKNGDEFMAVVHPYNIYDLMADGATAGGFVDITKYSQPDAALQGEIGKLAQCRIVTTTNTGNDGVAATSTKYYSYVFGKGGIGAVSLAGKGPSQVSDPKNQMFNLNVISGGPSPADPEGQIGTYVSYFFVYAAKTLDTVNYRYIITKADSSIV